MKNCISALLLAASGIPAMASDVYVGVGFPGLLGIGFARPLNASFGLRAEYSGGIKVSKDGNQEGVNVVGSLQGSRLGAFADYYPFQGGLRLVAGLTSNDIQAKLTSTGTGTAQINGKQVDMSGQRFDITVKYPSSTPYLGIGWGHQQSDTKGLGGYLDAGVMVGSFGISASTSLVGVQGITQADVDAQIAKISDATNKLTVLPSVSLGLVYRF
jgi:hypothetical protein